MLAPWIVNEMKTASLCDKRLNARLENILDQLGSRPTGSTPSACGGYAETAAAYRFFDNDRVTFDNVFQPHIDATRRRIEEQPVVIMVQDTTELDLTRPQQQVAGTGPMDGSSRRGMFMHLLHALTPEGTPLGTAHDQLGRTEENTTPCSKLSRHQRLSVPIEQKESYRWITTLEHVQHMASELPQTQFMCVADSEADIYELIVAGMAEPRHADSIMRACYDRHLPPGAKSDAEQGQETDESDTIPQNLRERVLTTPVLFRQTIQIRKHLRRYGCEERGRRKPRRARPAGRVCVCVCVCVCVVVCVCVGG